MLTNQSNGNYETVNLQIGIRYITEIRAVDEEALIRIDEGGAISWNISQFVKKPPWKGRGLLPTG